ncbi:MAG: GDSL-type esterase/lipase family protein [Candidatus Binatia bacterium]|nr:GDSL-type esterase/lipase family protein [Candidatus Binatia bacterium]
MSRRGEVLVGLALATIGVVGALAFVEIGVRLLHLVPDRFWEPDPKMGVRLVASKRGWWTQEEREFVVPVEINAQGLRDVPRSYAKPPGVYRVLVVGDSFVEAMHVRLDEMFTRRLERLLDGVSASKRVEVVSAGVSGWGTASELLWLQEEGVRYQPNLVLLSFYPGNDIKNNSPNLEETLPPVYDEEGNLRYVRSNKAKGAENPRLLARSKAYAFLRQLVFLRQPAVGRALERLGLVRLPPAAAPRLRNGLPVDYGVYEVPADEVWRDAWRRTERLLREVRDTAGKMGAQFGIVVIAGREQVSGASWDRILATYPEAKSKQFDLEQPEQWVEQWCQAERVPCLRLTPPFRAAVAAGQGPLHFWFDGHWTPEGHRVAADEVRKFLLANFPIS